MLIFNVENDKHSCFPPDFTGTVSSVFLLNKILDSAHGWIGEWKDGQKDRHGFKERWVDSNVLNFLSGIYIYI